MVPTWLSRATACALIAVAGASTGISALGCGGAKTIDLLDPTADAAHPEPTVDAGVIDAGADAGADAADAGGHFVHCVNAGQTSQCSVPSEVCCVAGSLHTCAPASTCRPPAATPIPCDKSTDCAAFGKPNAICCAAFVSASQIVVECVSRNQCDQRHGLEMCDPNDPSSSCDNGGTCTKSENLPGYSLCR